MIWQCRSITLLLTCVCGRRVGGKGLQGAAEVTLHVLGQQARGGAQPVWLFPASLSRLAQACGAAGSADRPVVHLKQHHQVQSELLRAEPLRFTHHPGSFCSPLLLPSAPVPPR